MSKLILASASPRRRELMELTDIPFTVIPADMDESKVAGLPPKTTVKHLARGKAEIVAKQYPDAVVIGADTVVAIDGEILGKPKNEENARRMLRLLSGREHCVHTGVCIILPGGTQITFCDTSRVQFRGISPNEIERYVTSGEPMGKAGSYAIQSEGGRFVRSYEGDFTNIVGLPIRRVLKVLDQSPKSGDELPF